MPTGTVILSENFYEVKIVVEESRTVFIKTVRLSLLSCYVGQCPTTILILIYVFFSFHQGGKRNCFLSGHFPLGNPLYLPTTWGQPPRPLLKSGRKAKAFLFVPSAL